MIRYVHIGDQINDDADEFAFFDTIPNRFVEIEGQHTFTDREDLEDAMDAAGMALGQRERLLGLLPEEGAGS